MTAEEMILKNVAFVKSEIARAAEEAGRDPAEIRLVAATKMNDAEAVRAAIRAGVDICGENRVQEMLEKNAQGAYAGVPLHFIGHLQKNKVRQVVGLCALIHSVDSLPLLQEISTSAEKRGLTQDVLLEINIGAEESKSGFSPEELGPDLEEAAKIPAVRVRGLMAIPPICEKPEENRPFFLKMQKLFVDNCRKKYDNISMDFLSMGMSGDYPEAIRCGANLVRIGPGFSAHGITHKQHRRLSAMGFMDELRKLTQPYEDEDDFYEGADPSAQPAAPTEAQLEFENAFGGKETPEPRTEETETPLRLPRRAEGDFLRPRKKEGPAPRFRFPGAHGGFWRHRTAGHPF